MQPIVLIAILIAGSLSTSAQKLSIAPNKVPKHSPEKTSYTLQQFMGKWQEVLRKDRNGNKVEFKDTLFFYFSGNNEVYARDGVNMSLKGNAAIQPGNILEAAADVFTIKSMNDNQVVLDDGEKYIHTLVKKKFFWYETLPTNAMEAEKYTSPVKASLSDISGKWTVYRRDARPGATDTEELLLKMLNIAENKTGNTMKGEVTFYKTGPTNTQPCTITLDGETMYIVTDKHSWHMDVYKADGKELIFGNAALMYYCKQM